MVEKKLPYCTECLSSFLREESLAKHDCQPVDKVTCCKCGSLYPRAVDVCMCDHEMSYCCKRKPCESCGAPVPEREAYPWPGHKPDCSLLKEWMQPYREDTKFLKLCQEMGVEFNKCEGATRLDLPLPGKTTRVSIGQTTFHFDIDRGLFLGVECDNNAVFLGRKK